MKASKEHKPQESRVIQNFNNMKSIHNLPHMLQRFSLDSKIVDFNERYINNNEKSIIRHMGGEWNKINENAVSGGHLLSAMEIKWGRSFSKSIPTLHTNPKPGIYFEENIPNDRIKKAQHTFRIVSQSGTSISISKPKSSTFWPKSWDSGKLRNTLNNSYKFGHNNSFVSNQNTSYWYNWQTLGDNSAFPISILPVTDSQRIRTKQGRKNALNFK